MCQSERLSALLFESVGWLRLPQCQVKLVEKSTTRLVEKKRQAPEHFSLDIRSKSA